ncbi:MAG: 16S rRNA (cytidine1402-2'-O)-methyltransferase, partial [Parcubacteria group bacterium Greene0416_14]
MSTFYVVATPIGNLEDITLRAIRVLKEVDLILCEDTRQTRKLLSAYDIRTPVESYHAQSTRGKAEKILKMLGEGKNL